MHKFRKYFVTGLIVISPIIITIYITVAMLNFLDNILGRFVESLLGFRIFGLGLLMFILLTFGIGMLAVNVWWKRIMPHLELVFMKIPFVHKIYPVSKQVINFLISDKKEAFFQKVVLVEYPRKGVYAIGFVTNEQSFKQSKDATLKELVNVFVPTSPGPLSGFLILVPRYELKYLDISVETAIKLIVSGGILNQ